MGGFILMELSDLRRMSPLWLKYSEDVRADPDVRPGPLLLPPQHPAKHSPCFVWRSGTVYAAPCHRPRPAHPLEPGRRRNHRLRWIASTAGALGCRRAPPLTRRPLCVPQAWQLSGDAYATHPGDKPWISEMYGYSFGAAKADVWHKYHTTAMIYPGYLPIGAASLLPHPAVSLEDAEHRISFDQTTVSCNIPTQVSALHRCNTRHVSCPTRPSVSHAV